MYEDFEFSRSIMISDRAKSLNRQSLTFEQIGKILGGNMIRVYRESL